MRLRNHTRHSLAVFIIFLSTINMSIAGDHLLAEKGKAQYNLVISPTSGTEEKFAVEELSCYLTKMTKANFSSKGKYSSRSIMVGTIASLRKIAPEISLPMLEGEEYGIFERDKKLILTGGNERALLYAIYDFLGGLGCRWIAPDFEFYEGSSHHIPRIPELIWSHTSDIVKKPVMKYRKLYIEEGLSHNTTNLLQMIEWMPKLHFNVIVFPTDYQGHGRVKWDNWREDLIPEIKKRGIILEVGGHGYQNFLHAGMENGQLFDQHPNWFGLDGEGNRTKNPRWVFCTSNDSAVDYLHANIRKYLTGRPEIDIFDFWPPDSETWCTCPNCQALGNPVERHALLVKQTAEMVHRDCKGVQLECLGYSKYTEPPAEAGFDKSVLVDFCPINQSFEYQIYDESSENNVKYKANLLRWLEVFSGDISIYSYYRKYAWRSLPVQIPHYMQKDLKYYREIGVQGISTYAEPGDWFTYGLNHYVLGHLASDPDVDVDSLMQLYCKVLYGDAAPVALSVYRELEEIVRFGSTIPFTKPKTDVRYDQYAARLKKLEASVREAMEIHKQNLVLYHHLHRMELMLDYATQNMAAAKLAAGGRTDESDKSKEKTKQKLRENANSGIFIVR